ncbi:PaaI family thioesterase [Xenophilus arseniciresistens]|uniref:PaaI family thioesterase n=1 Tax=Xenophilus arseniciresistens TaxID=1283306 RepID=A0AAE3SZD1_9BURK|nr:PaaI family thioesterase [Xenophilus arseniciresistens]MDA7417047.1 PaaI family thioesterase [Xenophilus arseniciresistens]
MSEPAGAATRRPDPALRARVARIFEGAPFVADIGLQLVDAGQGWCETALPLAARHLQHGGVAHAGVISTLADHTAGAAAQTLCAPGQTVVTAEFKLNLLRPGQGRLLCVAEVLKAGRNFHVVEAEVFGQRGSEQVRVAKFNGTMAIVAGDF